MTVVKLKIRSNSSHIVAHCMLFLNEHLKFISMKSVAFILVNRMKTQTYKSMYKFILHIVHSEYQFLKKTYLLSKTN